MHKQKKHYQGHTLSDLFVALNLKMVCLAKLEASIKFMAALSQDLQKKSIPRVLAELQLCSQHAGNCTLVKNRVVFGIHRMLFLCMQPVANNARRYSHNGIRLISV